MFSRLALPALALLVINFLALHVVAHETNAQRMQRGMSPMRPKRLHTTPVDLAARTFPSGNPSDCSASLEGYLTIRGPGGTFLGWLDDSGETFTRTNSHACKYQYGGLGYATTIKKKGTGLYLGVYGRSILNSFLSHIQGLSWTNGRNSFTSCKLFSGIYNGAFGGGAHTYEGSYAQSDGFTIHPTTKEVSCKWKQGYNGIDLDPILCKNGDSISVQWVKGSSASSLSMGSICPGGITTGITVKFECSC